MKGERVDLDLHEFRIILLHGIDLNIILEFLLSLSWLSLPMRIAHNTRTHHRSRHLFFFFFFVEPRKEGEEDRWWRAQTVCGRVVESSLDAAPIRRRDTLGGRDVVVDERGFVLFLQTIHHGLAVPPPGSRRTSHRKQLAAVQQRHGAGCQRRQHPVVACLAAWIWS